MFFAFVEGDERQISTLVMGFIPHDIPVATLNGKLLTEESNDRGQTQI
jgi:hypothetical protein